MTQLLTDPDRAALAVRCACLRHRLDALPRLGAASALSGSDWISARTRHAQAVDALLDWVTDLPDRVSVSIGCYGARVRMLGVKASSTEGVIGALRNWLAKAEALSCTPRV